MRNYFEFALKLFPLEHILGATHTYVTRATNGTFLCEKSPPVSSKLFIMSKGVKVLSWLLVNITTTRLCFHNVQFM